jgi:hypothetical protein
MAILRQRRAVRLLGVGMETYSRNELSREEQFAFSRLVLASPTTRHRMYWTSFTTQFSSGRAAVSPFNCAPMANCSQRKN